MRSRGGREERNEWKREPRPRYLCRCAPRRRGVVVDALLPRRRPPPRPPPTTSASAPTPPQDFPPRLTHPTPLPAVREETRGMRSCYLRQTPAPSVCRKPVARWGVEIRDAGTLAGDHHRSGGARGRCTNIGQERRRHWDPGGTERMTTPARLDRTATPQPPGRASRKTGQEIGPGVRDTRTVGEDESRIPHLPSDGIHR